MSERMLSMSLLDILSGNVLPVLLLMILGICYLRTAGGKDVFSGFTEGAADGLHTVIKIFPTLVGLMTAVAVFRASGLMDAVSALLKPVTDMIHIPGEVMPLALLRPVTGSGSLAVLAYLYRKYGPDGGIGRTASVIMGSTETTLYTVSVYFGAVGVKNIRHTLVAGLLADLATVIGAAFIVRWLDMG